MESNRNSRPLKPIKYSKREQEDFSHDKSCSGLSGWRVESVHEKRRIKSTNDSFVNDSIVARNVIRDRGAVIGFGFDFDRP